MEFIEWNCQIILFRSKFVQGSYFPWSHKIFYILIIYFIRFLLIIMLHETGRVNHQLSDRSLLINSLYTISYIFTTSVMCLLIIMLIPVDVAATE